MYRLDQSGSYQRIAESRSIANPTLSFANIETNGHGRTCIYKVDSDGVIISRNRYFTKIVPSTGETLWSSLLPETFDIEREPGFGPLIDETKCPNWSANNTDIALFFDSEAIIFDLQNGVELLSIRSASAISRVTWTENAVHFCGTGSQCLSHHIDGRNRSHLLADYKWLLGHGGENDVARAFRPN